MTANTPFTETQKSSLLFNLWHQTLDVMHAALKEQLPFNGGVYFFNTETETETRMSQPDTSLGNQP